ncbi:decaprenyl-phosphate phosphoribosyltransferase [Actinosynnema sp. NPDC049800]
MSDTGQKSDTGELNETGEPGSTTARGTGAITGLVRAVRPHQWVKNFLVLAAPFAANRLGEPAVLLDTGLALVAFCLAASAVYLVNDAIDVDADRAHPTKRRRPIADGVVSTRTAYVAATALFVAAVAVSLVSGPPLAVVIGVYCAAQLGYCLGWKHQPVIDLCIVASGFLLRAIAGGIAAGIPLSQWFLLVTAFGSLFMVAGKRYAEIVLYERTGAEIRASLRRYSASYLRFVWATAAAIMILAYSLWAFEMRERADYDSGWAMLSIVPFVVAVLRYAVDVDDGGAGEPERIALRDHVLQVIGACWVVSLALSIYV